MKKRIYKEENYKRSKWSGGNTRELAIYPEKAEYLDRDFLWRLSSADSDLEESSFTKLPDYDRILMVLEGSVVLAHGAERTASLSAYEYDAFDGAIKTKCFGKLIKDYNLIYRKGCKGRMELVDLTEDAQQVESQFEGSRCLGVYCAEGYTVVSADGKTDMVKADEQMVIELEPGEEVSLSVMGQGKCILTEVAFEKEEVLDFSQEAAEGGEAQTGGSDFALALKLSLGNNRWSGAMRKMKKKGLLYSPALEKKLRFLDKYFITGLVWCIGIILCILLLPAGVSGAAVFGLVIAFSIVDVFLISPLIYLMVLPRPISAHIKSSENLTAYEQKIFEEQLNFDPQQERLKRKYRDRSGETYDGIGDFWRRMNKDD